MTRVAIRPELLRWARERSGLGVRSLESRFPKLEAWERREVLPTFKQLEDFARATHTPIGFLFLAEPPVERIPIPDLRTLAGAPFPRPSPDLLETIYLCQHRQDWYREFVRVNGGAPLGFVGSARKSEAIDQVASRMRTTLGLEVAERARLGTWQEALRRMVDQAEEAGILVMVSGIVGSNAHRPLNPSEFRGFALSDAWVPLVFVNGADSKAAQMFTLAHELAHLWLGETAVSDADTAQPPRHEIERWCDQVAAELLMPLDSVRSEHNRAEPLLAEANRLARRFKVSTLVALRRIHDTGCIDHSIFWDAFDRERSRLLTLPKGKKSGGDFFATLGVRVGRSLAHALVVSTLEGRTSFTEAFRLLGIKKLSTFDTLAKRLGFEPS